MPTLTEHHRIAVPAWKRRWSRHMRTAFKLLVLLLVVAAFAVLFVLDPVPLQALRNIGFDQYQRWHPRVYQDAPVRIIDIDDESLRRLGQWPWPRTRLAELVTHLQDAAPSAVAFDVVFAEPDRTSPKAMLDAGAAPPVVRRWLESQPDHDAALARALAGANVVLGQSVTSEPSSGGAAPQPKARFIVSGEAPNAFLHTYPAGVPVLPELEAAAAGLGFITFIPDSDGVVRRVPLVLNVGGVLVPSLTAEALRVAQGARNDVVRSVGAAGVGVAEVRIGQVQLPTNAAGEVWLHYSTPQAQRYIPAWKVLAGLVPAQALAGNILLVGTSAKGLLDLRFTPLEQAIPGVEIHAQMLEQALSGSALVRPSWAGSLEAVILMVGGLGVGVVALFLGPGVSFAVTAMVLALLGAGVWHAFAVQGVLLDATLPGMAILAAFGVASVVRHLSSERRQRWIRQAFSRYVSPNLVAFLIRQPESLQLGGRRQDCSFVFTDLAGFTSLVERVEAEAVGTLINEYLDGMIAIAFQHDGTLIRIVGDGIVIMFSAPVAQADHQRRAMACAWDMRQFSLRYAQEQSERGVPFGQTRIGIHSGNVIVGNFGGSSVFDYRALGDPVNTAARLESANKQLGTWVCVSADTLAGCPDWPVRPIGRVLLQGKTVPLMVYELLDPLLAQGGDRAFTAAYAQLLADPAQGLAAFTALAAERAGDALVALHLERLRAGHRDDLIVLTQK